jgi:TetR/AcrR family transcriptional repressor of multidrug resistance operon
MMARTAGRNGTATRERLLRAAIELYASTGFLQTTTPALASRAGIAEGTIYRHFTSKEHLLNEAHRLASRWAIGVVTALEQDRVRKTPERLGLLARQLIDLAMSDPPLLRLWLDPSVRPFLDEQSRNLAREARDGVTRLMAIGKSDGQVRAGPAELWADVWLAIVGHIAQRVATREWMPDGTQVMLALEAAWAAVQLRD